MNKITRFVALFSMVWFSGTAQAAFVSGNTAYLNCETCFDEQEFLTFVEEFHRDTPMAMRYVVSHKGQAIKDQSVLGNLVTVEILDHSNTEPTSWEEWFYLWLIEHFDLPVYGVQIVATADSDVAYLESYIREAERLHFPLVYGENVVKLPKVDLLFVLNSFKDLVQIVKGELLEQGVNPFYATDKTQTVRIEISGNHWVYLVRGPLIEDGTWQHFLTIENTPEIELSSIETRYDLPDYLTPQNRDAFACISRLNELGVEINLFCRRKNDKGNLGRYPFVFQPKGLYDPEPCSPLELECNDDKGGIDFGNEF